jgi:hypothetical protein
MNKLLLIIHYKPNDLGLLVLKTEEVAVRIDHLYYPKMFVGNMKLLSASIGNGAKMNCYYTLRNKKGLVWVLACETVKEMVSLRLWTSDFYWQGTALTFRKAIQLL